MMKSHQRPLRTHRIAWTLRRGAIPDDKTLDHLCRVPACVNPEHMALVSNKENILRGDSFSARNARKTHCKRGHELCGKNVTVTNGHRHCRLCVKERKQLSEVS